MKGQGDAVCMRICTRHPFRKGMFQTAKIMLFYGTHDFAMRKINFPVQQVQ